MEKSRKYNYYRVIQQNYGQGWEDVSFYPSNSQYIIIDNHSGVFFTNKYGRQQEKSILSHDLAEYRLSGYPTRVINRKEKVEVNAI